MRYPLRATLLTNSLSHAAVSTLRRTATTYCAAQRQATAPSAIINYAPTLLNDRPPPQAPSSTMRPPSCSKWAACRTATPSCTDPWSTSPRPSESRSVRRLTLASWVSTRHVSTRHLSTRHVSTRHLSTRLVSTRHLSTHHVSTRLLGVHSPRDHSPRVHSPRDHSPSVHSPSVQSPRVHSPHVHSPSVQSPRVHSPRVHSMLIFIDRPRHSATPPVHCIPQFVSEPLLHLSVSSISPSHPSQSSHHRNCPPAGELALVPPVV